MTEEETKVSEKKKDAGVFGGLLAESGKAPKRTRPSKKAGEATARPAPKSEGAAPRTKRREYVYLQVRLDPDEGKALDLFCVEHGTSRTDAVRALLDLLRDDGPTTKKVVRALRDK